MSSTLSSIQVHDLSNNPLAVIPLGSAKVRIGYIRIIHPIDLIQIGNTIANVNEEIQSHPSTSPLYELMQIKNNKLYETFMKIRPFVTRHKRWDTIGTIWKWVAGNPDAEDLRIINATMNSLIEQNNKQIMINQAISKRIQEVTDITNQIITMEREMAKNHSIEINHLMVLSNLDSLQDQIETLEEAILMAKHGIPSSKLLSMQDFNTISNFLGRHDVFVTSFEELLSSSTAQVTLNHTHIAYILKVPQFSKNEYEYDFMDSVIKYNKRIALKQNHLMRNATHIYELIQPCTDQGEYFLCEHSNLIPTTECIDRILRGQHSNCTFEKTYSRGLVKRINEGTIFINDAVITVSSNCTNSNQFLNGSFLIHFEDCSLQVNGEYFSNFETVIPGRPYHPTTGLIVAEIDTIDSPPVDYLQNLTLEHRDQLEVLQLENNSLQWKINLFGSLGGFTVLSIVAILGIYIYISRKTVVNAQITIPSIEKEDIALKEIGPFPSSELSDERKKEIESFINMPSPFRKL